jgi:hypothetical protein
VAVAVPVGAGVKAKQLDVVVAKQRLRVGVKGAAPIIDVSVRMPGPRAVCACAHVRVCQGRRGGVWRRRLRAEKEQQRLREESNSRAASR